MFILYVGHEYYACICYIIVMYDAVTNVIQDPVRSTNEKLYNVKQLSNKCGFNPKGNLKWSSQYT